MFYLTAILYNNMYCCLDFINIPSKSVHIACTAELNQQFWWLFNSPLLLPLDVGNGAASAPICLSVPVAGK